MKDIRRLAFIFASAILDTIGFAPESTYHV